MSHGVTFNLSPFFYLLLMRYFNSFFQYVTLASSFSAVPSLTISFVFLADNLFYRCLCLFSPLIFIQRNLLRQIMIFVSSCDCFDRHMEHFHNQEENNRQIDKIGSRVRSRQLRQKIRQPRKDTEHNENGRESQPENRILDLEF